MTRSLYQSALTMDHFALENRARIVAVENSFQPRGKSLLIPNRVLVGEGRLLKLCRKRIKPKSFFLFNDIMVYGSIVVPGRWNNQQKVLRLEEVEQENLEDGEGMNNQWVIRTPRKSFFVSAASWEEKHAWMEHIERCRVEHLRQLDYTPQVKQFAMPWIPDRASDRCMRCYRPFTVTQRRHHCRHCGFVVCKTCSKNRAVLKNISAKPVRVCGLCKGVLHSREARAELRKKGSLEDVPKYEASSDEESDEAESQASAQCDDNSSSFYCTLDLQHGFPPRTQSSKYRV